MMSKPSALVTGGASGIGLAATKHLLSQGYRVGILDINKQAGEAEAEKLGQDCMFQQVDVSSYSQQAHAFKRVYEWAGDRLDVLIANAGIADTDGMYKEGAVDEEGLPLPLNLKVIDVNLNAVLQEVRLFIHFARKRAEVSGKIVITSSVVGLYPNYTIPLYAASKHALVGFVRSAAPVLAVENISINAICPTLIETGLMPAEYRDLWDPKQLTPMSTAIKAYDTILNDATITGQTIELALEELIFKQPPEYSTDNTVWMFSQMNNWERAMAYWLPRETGKNAKSAS